jgi:hypothetical protein
MACGPLSLKTRFALLSGNDKLAYASAASFLPFSTASSMVPTM